ncbi:hypothetical protein G7046_g2015 [Stylonectria norvegica]|nr:hypothetical protein G7046_g2015 [Stylonectria norvegica]
MSDPIINRSVPSAPSSVSDFPDKPSSLACVECRKKHLKCDAHTPSCSRCDSQGWQCRYEASRRGLKRRKLHQPMLRPVHGGENSGAAGAPVCRPSRREPEQIVWDSADPHGAFMGFQPEQVLIPDQNESPWRRPSMTVESLLVDSAPTSNYMETDTEADAQACVLTLPQITAETNAEEDELEDDKLLVNLFYANFFKSHPFLVPRQLYEAQRYPAYLKLVVHLIGCHYSGTECSETMQGLADVALTKAWQQEKHRNYVLVQALTLFSIILHARCVPEKSRSSLSQAVSLALDLKMYHKRFSISQSGGSSVIEESLRRTWWELYITDGFMAALQGKTHFRCNNFKADVPLPCDEPLYTGDLLLLDPPTLEQFEARIFAHEEQSFSSFSYRIEAAQLLARALTIAATQELHRDQMQNIDNLLAAWPHHLDLEKLDPAGAVGGVDQILLQAHLMIQYTTMHLHYPRSELVRTSSATSGLVHAMDLLPTYSRSAHSLKAIEAAKRFADLAALETSPLRYSPLVLNGLLLSCAVQLSACSLRPSGFYEQYHSRLCLSLGLLKTLSPVWALARDVAEKIKMLTLEILPKESGEGEKEAGSLIDSGIDIGTLADVDEYFPWMSFSPLLRGEGFSGNDRDT